jgi:uncharacterized membrane protein YphA (DoxX/SURF4 family)
MNITLIILSFAFIILFVLQVRKSQHIVSILLISRVFIAIVFLYSGFVKAVDPLGYTYKIIDYFTAFGMDAFKPLAFYLAIAITSAEFLIGFGLLLGIFLKLYSRLATLFMIVFTPLTLYLAISNPVTDCGCFGDALIITNWQTFWKNLIIDIPLVILLLQNKNLKDSFTFKNSVILNILGLVFIVYISIYSFMHLPIIDFRPYKIGNNIQEGMQIPEGKKSDVYKSTFTYKNKNTQEEKKFEENNLNEPLNNEDLWEFIDSKTILIEEGYHPPIHDFSIINETEGDITEQVLRDSSYTFILVSYNLNKVNFGGLVKFEQLSKSISNANFLILTAALNEEISRTKDSLIDYLSYDTLLTKEVSTKTIYFYEFEGNVIEFDENEIPEDKAYIFIGTEDIETEIAQKAELSFDFNICDPTTLKTIIRANPGMILIKSGTIINKWHYNDFPNQEEILKIIN